jgi:hypothetical protein
MGAWMLRFYLQIVQRRVPLRQRPAVRLQPARGDTDVNELEINLCKLSNCLLAFEKYEDAAGHLCDLLEFCRLRIKPNVGEPFPDLRSLVEHYGKNPNPPKV